MKAIRPSVFPFRLGLFALQNPRANCSDRIERVNKRPTFSVALEASFTFVLGQTGVCNAFPI